MRGLTRRDILRSGLLAGGAMAFPGCSTFAASANEEIRLGFISCGGRAGQLMGPFSKPRGLWSPACAIRMASVWDPRREGSRMPRRGPICGVCWTTRTSMPS